MATLLDPSPLPALQKAAGPLPGAGLSWLSRSRQLALERFAELGWPSAADERWRFTSVDRIARADYAAAPARPRGLTAAAILKRALAPLDAYRLVFLDGRVVPDLSSAPPKDAFLASLSGALAADPAAVERLWPVRAQEQDAFAALNAGLFSDGAALSVPRGVTLDKPVHLVFASTAGARPSAWHGRVVVAAGPGSAVQLVEEHLSLEEGAALSTIVSDVAVGEGAAVEHVTLQRQNESAFHVERLRVRQARDSRLTAHAVTVGGALVRNDVAVRLEEEGAQCALNGLYVLSGRQHVDNHTLIEHAAARGVSRELYKGVLGGQARAVFDGPIHVLPAAQKTDAMVYNKNLLLSEQGLVNTKPEFKISANDVQCKHGATIGQLREDALFYLRSRGIGEAQARALLVFAFASEMLDRLPFASVRQALTGALTQRFLGGEASDE